MTLDDSKGFDFLECGKVVNPTSLAAEAAGSESLFFLFAGGSIISLAVTVKLQLLRAFLKLFVIDARGFVVDLRQQLLYFCFFVLDLAVASVVMGKVFEDMPYHCQDERICLCLTLGI